MGLRLLLIHNLNRVRVSKFGYQGASVCEQGWGLGIQTSMDKICSDIESLKGSRYPNNLDTETPV